MRRGRGLAVAAGALFTVVAAGGCGGLRPGALSDRTTTVAKPGEAHAGAGAKGAPRTRPVRLRFAVIGDFGDGSVAQAALARRMCWWRRRHPFRLVITTGDNLYPDGSRRYFHSRFFRPYRCLRRHGVKFHSSLGNHDYITRRGGPELATPAFGIPRRNYVLRRNGVRFVIANSNRLRVGWLRRRLPARPGDRWTFTVFHHPVLSPGPHGPTPGFRPLLPRLFRKAGVDIVLNGHDHLFSVTRRRGGIRYVVTGGGGGVTYPCVARWFTKLCISRQHFLYVVAGRRSIRVRAVGIAGRPFAHFHTRGRP
jgi:Calcineurin-like phosphoesterase